MYVDKLKSQNTALKKVNDISSVFNCKPRIINQELYDTRVSKVREQYGLYINTTTQSLFGRDVDGLIQQILLDCDLKSILVLRLVSKGFYYLASCLISVKFAPLDLLRPNSEKFQFVQQNDRSIKIIVSSPQDAECLIRFINTPNSIILLKKIESIDFDRVDDQTVERIQKLINLIAAPDNPFSSLRSLSFKKILSYSFKLPELPHVTSLTIGDIVFPFVFQSSSYLTSLSIGGIFTFFTLPVFPNLVSLSIGQIGSPFEKEDRVALKFSDLSNLTSLSIKNIYVSINFPNLPNLISLSINDVKASITFLESPRLNFLSLGTIDDNFIFPDCPNLAELFINRVISSVTLPEFSKLLSLYINNLEGSLTLPEFSELTFLCLNCRFSCFLLLLGEYPNLLSFSFEKILFDRYLDEMLKNLEKTVEIRRNNKKLI